MKQFMLVLVILGMQFGADAVFAQANPDDPVQPTEIDESGREYLKSLRFSRVDTRVVYFDPTSTAPALDTSARPPKPPSDRNLSDQQLRWTFGLVALAIILGILWGFYKSAGGVSLSLGSEQDVKRRNRRRANATGLNPDPPDLSAILAIRDRRIAIVALAQSALAKAARSQGLIMQRSWTAREGLRKVAKSEPNISALRALVHAAERVHFGHHAISDQEFDALASGIRPIFGAAQNG